MNVNINRPQPPKEQNSDDKAQLEELINLMGTLGGYDPETFEQEKQAILESGITYDDMMSIVTDNFKDKMGPREIVDVKIQRLTDTARIPEYAHLTDACADLYADETVIINPGETKMISTGLAMAFPPAYVVHIYPRSSIGLKTPLRLPNSVGVIDSNYRDEIKMIYTNTGDKPYEITKGTRIAQMSIDLAPMARFEVVDDIKEFGEDRGGGFGSTGEN